MTTYWHQHKHPDVNLAALFPELMNQLHRQVQLKKVLWCMRYILNAHILFSPLNSEALSCHVQWRMLHRNRFVAFTSSCKLEILCASPILLWFLCESNLTKLLSHKTLCLFNELHVERQHYKKKKKKEKSEQEILATSATMLRWAAVM